MITDCKSVSALLRRITSNNNGDFYCLNCLHSYRTKDRLKKHENVYKDHDYCYIEMPKENKKILIIKHHQQLKETNIQLLVILCLLIVHLMLQKIN